MRRLCAPSWNLMAAGTFLCVLGWAPPANAQENPDPPPPNSSIEINEEGEPIAEPAPRTGSATLELLRAIEARHAEVATIQGSFDQLKVSEIFQEETPSKGTFWFQKPDRFRCDYAPPNEVTNLIVEDSIYVYVPELEQVERYKFYSEQERDQQLHTMVLGFGFEAEKLVKEYEVLSSADEPALAEELQAGGMDPEAVVLLHVTPLEALLETSPFTNLKLWIDKKTLLPRRVWFEDYNGDKTTISIVDLKLNAEIDPSRFEAKFPPGTEMIDKSEF